MSEEALSGHDAGRLYHHGVAGNFFLVIFGIYIQDEKGCFISRWIYPLRQASMMDMWFDVYVAVFSLPVYKCCQLSIEWCENCNSSCQAVVITSKEATTELKGVVLIYYLSVPAEVDENEMRLFFLTFSIYFNLQNFDWGTEDYHFMTMKYVTRDNNERHKWEQRIIFLLQDVWQKN